MLSLRFLSARDLPFPSANEEAATWSIEVQGGSSRCIHVDRGTEQQEANQVSSSSGNLPAFKAWCCIGAFPPTFRLLVWVQGRYTATQLPAPNGENCRLQHFPLFAGENVGGGTADASCLTLRLHIV